MNLKYVVVFKHDYSVLNLNINYVLLSCAHIPGLSD